MPLRCDFEGTCHLKLFVLVALAAVAFGACSSSTEPFHRLPPAPTPVAPSAPAPVSSNALSGMVVENSGVCIDGAKVEIVDGQGVGRNMIQMSPCSAWDSEGGFVFRDLNPDVALTVRASAAGYAAQQKTLL